MQFKTPLLVIEAHFDDFPERLKRWDVGFFLCRFSYQMDCPTPIASQTTGVGQS